ncbi:hypothetical protein ACIRFF_11895 [Streptomyces cyaneofuscatus]
MSVGIWYLALTFGMVTGKPPGPAGLLLFAVTGGAPIILAVTRMPIDDTSPPSSTAPTPWFAEARA